jgi:hypothetical protein
VSNVPSSVLERMRHELHSLAGRLGSLREFLNGDKASTIDPAQLELLKEQEKHMAAYADVLRRRIELTYPSNNPQSIKQ